MELIVDFHVNTKRQGPGSPADTLRALQFTDLTEEGDLQVADIGCGTGAQTLTLAEKLKGQITALDLYPEFLDVLDRNASKAGFKDRIRTFEGSMESLPFKAASLDLVWSEGAIYNMGFEAGIRAWRDYLKPGGYLAVSEITWITASRPAEIEAFWEGEYPEISRASTKIQQLEAHGYTLAGYFTLPGSSWIRGYYQPLEGQFEPFLKRHGYSEAARHLVEASREEIALYERYGQYYSYGFYVARKD